MFEVPHIRQVGQGRDLSGQSGVVRVRGPAGSGYIYSRWERGEGRRVGVEGEWRGVEGSGGSVGRKKGGECNSGGRMGGVEESGREWREKERMEVEGGMGS